MSNSTVMGEKLVQDQSGDWYVIPKDNVAIWEEKYSYETYKEPPAWAIYVQNPTFLTLYEWESDLR